jgi:hypothetical protein
LDELKETARYWKLKEEYQFALSVKLALEEVIVLLFH